MGNRVKGRTKRKSVKAAVHSGMSAKRKLSRMGKVQKRDHSGLDATFVGRAKALKMLQVSLKDFRRLCILKGVYPREPRGRAPRNKKGQVFYHIKDVRALAHEPLLDQFREFKSFMKKVRRSANRNEKDEARRKRETLAPTYTLHHLVRERYPRFADALGDLDDALCLVHLFACLPSDGRVRADVTRKAQGLAAAWGAYCAATGSVAKSFVSVKGVYMEADVVVSLFSSRRVSSVAELRGLCPNMEASETSTGTPGTAASTASVQFFSTQKGYWICRGTGKRTMGDLARHIAPKNESDRPRDHCLGMRERSAGALPDTDARAVAVEQHKTAPLPGRGDLSRMVQDETIVEKVLTPLPSRSWSRDARVVQFFRSWAVPLQERWYGPCYLKPPPAHSGARSEEPVFEHASR